MKKYGNANEFYRARVINLTPQGVENFEWSEEILYQEPKRREVKINPSYQIQIINIDDNVLLNKKNFKSEEKAKTLLDDLKEDLEILTKAEFDEKYLNADEAKA